MSWRKLLYTLSILCVALVARSQNVEIDVNLNIKHVVGGVSDFGRERHIGIHSNLVEPDWDGEESKLNYLLNTLDAYMGRDNGSATWKFASTPQDPNNPNHPAMDSMVAFGSWCKGEYEKLTTRHQYENRTKGMIMGTNAHPTYPTLSWYSNGMTWTNPQWQPKDIQTSRDWVVQYLDKFFAKSATEQGEPLPRYWEVVNEPDMEYMTGKFMVASQEKIWEYHNLVAQGVKARLGAKAPKIGGMTWGLHDLYSGDGVSRYNPDYLDQWVTDPAARQQYRDAAATQWPGNQPQPWYQWDVQWKGFIDAAGANMDFYAVHLYDWPVYNASGGTIRSGGHTEATLEMLEWYDVKKFGRANRKPVVISEYGAVQGAWAYTPHSKRYDWENIKPFSSMLMQFLERPDYIVHTLPFTPIKAQWGDTDSNGDGIPEYFYQYKMLRDDDRNGVWEWSDYIKWYELWSEVKGTRIDTKSSDPDVQVDAYVDGRFVYLILNNLEDEATTIDLNLFGHAGNSIQSVNTKHLHLVGTDNVTLSNTNGSVPATIQLAPDGTMILKYQFASNVNVNQTSTETKFFGEAPSGSVPHRATIPNGEMTLRVNGVIVPPDASKAEAMLKLTCALYADDDNKVGHLSIDKLKVNGVEIPVPLDWRGTNQLRSRHFGTLEIPVPVNLLQTNNTFLVDFHHVGEVAVANLLVWNFTQAPGRTSSSPTVAVSGVTVSPTSASIAIGQTQQLTATVSPANATNKSITWTSSNTAIATVNSTGLVTAVAAGSATITVKTVDGNKTATSAITVTSGTVAVTGVSVSPTSASVAAGQTQQLTATVLPANATNKSVTWTSSNTAIATVNSTGLVTAVAAGSATITVKTVDGNKTATSAITVTSSVAVTGVSVSPTSASVAVGQTQQLTATVLPANATNKSVTWTSSNTAIATVNSTGFVTAVAAGSATITVKTVDGNKTATSAITVTAGSPAVTFTIEAETFNRTGGTYNDGFVPLGANKNAGIGINYVNGGDYVEYDVNVATSGVYSFNYIIATPLSGNIFVQMKVDGATISNVAVPNTGGWETYQSLSGGNSLNLPSGVHTFRFTASGTDAWQWNLDKIQFTKTGNLPAGGVTLTVQAENFSATGGTFAGFQVYTVNGITAINYNQTGDWGDYTVNVPESGSYSVEYFVGTAVTGAAIRFILDGVTIRTDNVPNNGNWDNFVSLKPSGTININAGTHTIRLLGAGTNGWEWNMDKFILTKPAGAARMASKESDAELSGNETSLEAYPTPVNDILTVTGLRPGPCTIIIKDITGRNVLSEDTRNNGILEINVSRYTEGLYILNVTDKESVQSVKFIVQH